MYILLFCAFFFFKGQKRDGYKKSEGIPEKPKADLTKKVNKKCKPDKKCEAFFVSKKIFFCQTWTGSKSHDNRFTFFVRSAIFLRFSEGKP
jgi:hypothetical protein